MFNMGNYRKLWQSLEINLQVLSLCLGLYVF